jgi:hypothetical protein
VRPCKVGSIQLGRGYPSHGSDVIVGRRLASDQASLESEVKRRVALVAVASRLHDQTILDAHVDFDPELLSDLSLEARNGVLVGLEKASGNVNGPSRALPP